MFNLPVVFDRTCSTNKIRHSYKLNFIAAGKKHRIDRVTRKRVTHTRTNNELSENGKISIPKSSGALNVNINLIVTTNKMLFENNEQGFS